MRVECESGHCAPETMRKLCFRWNYGIFRSGKWKSFKFSLLKCTHFLPQVICYVSASLFLTKVTFWWSWTRNMEQKPNQDPIFFSYKKLLHHRCFRSTHREMCFKKGAHKNFAKFTGKHLCQSSFFNKVAGLRSATLLKRDAETVLFLWIWSSF